MALTGLTKVQKVGINTATIPTLGGSENVGVVTATTFVGDGSGLSNVTGSGSGVIVRDGGSLVGTAGTINFGTNLNVSAISAGIVTVTNAVSASALTNLSDVTVTSASNGQILKHNGSVFVNTAERTYSQSSVASGSNVNLRLSDGSTDDDILITAGSNITFSSVSANGFTIAASGGGGGGGGLSNVVEDTTPELGGDLNLNNKFITGSGGINVSGVTTSTSFVGNITGNVTGNADTATTATNVTVSANNSTDETVYPIFVDGATGAQGAESDTGLSYNPSSGNLTATKFTGSGVALTGVVTSIVAGSNISLAGGPTGIVTISSSGGGGLSLSSGTNNNVVTASSATALNGESNLTFDGTTLTLTGNQTASGSIVVGSGVTIDARGINAVGKGVTAGTFNALSGSFNVQIGSLNQGFYLNNSNNTWLGLSWSSSASIYQFRGNSGGNYPIVVDDFSAISLSPKSGGVNLNFAENNKLSTTSGGISVTGIATATGFSGPLTGNVTGNADTATTATNVTVTANNSTNETVYPIFVDGATGAQGAESDTGLSYNPSSGALTAGSFVKSGGSSSQFLKADGSVDSNTYLTSGSYLENVVEDTTPQLGGNLDLNSKNITGTGNAQIVGVITATSAVPTWTLGASGTDHYTFTGNGFTSATNDPDIYLVRGQRYAFLNNSGGNHPFQIQSDANSTAYNTGVTNNNATSGYITFNVPMSAPAHLYYKCSNHPNMLGNIYIVGQHLANGANNRIITATSAYGINGEANLTFDGSSSPASLGLTGDLNVVGGWPKINLQATQASGENYQIAGAIQGVSNQGFCIRNATDSANVIEIDQDSSRNLKVVSGNVVIGTAGKGIDFSATGDASGMSSELLDDYEEGSFTPTYNYSGRSFSYYLQSGSYVKIGKTVHFILAIGTSSTSGSGTSGPVKIDGLPFTANARSAVAIRATNFASDPARTATVENGATFMELIKQTSTGTTDMTGSSLSTSNYGNIVYAAGHYETNS